MANPNTYPSDGRITSLQNYTAALTGGELFPIVAPGNATAGINYNVTAQFVANQFMVISTTIATVPQGGTNTSVLGTGLLLGNGTAAVSFVPATTAGLVLTSQGSTSPPIFTTAAPAEFSPQNPNTVLAGPASGVATAAPTFRALVPLDLPGLVRNAVASSYTVATTDINKLIGMIGSPSGLPFVLSLGTATGYTTSFVVTLYNESSARGWAIAPNNVATFVLWPLQTVQVFRDNNSWKLSPSTQPWLVPAGTFFQVDNVNGSDSAANDGLGTQGTNGCFATVQNAVGIIQKQAIQLGGTVGIQLPATTSTAITEQVTVIGAMPPGVAVLQINGNPTSATACQWQIANNQQAVAISDYQSMTFDGIGFSCNGTVGATFVAADQYCIADFENCDFGSNGLGGTNITVKQGGRVNILTGCSISGTTGQFLQMSAYAGGAIGSAINVVGTPNIGGLVKANQGALVNLNGLSFTGNTAGIAGQRWASQNGGIVIGDSGVTWPSGLTAGSISNGGLSDAGAANYNGSATVLAATPLVSGGTTGAGYTFFSVTDLGMFAGTGVPSLTAATSALYLRNDAVSSTTRLYINTNGGSTWVGLTATG